MKTMTKEQLLEERTSLIVKDTHRIGDVTLGSLEQHAQNVFNGILPFDELQEVAQRAYEMFLAAGPAKKATTQDGPPQLTYPATRELTLDFLTATPKATAKAAYEWIRANHGVPSCKLASFQASIAPSVRKQIRDALPTAKAAEPKRAPPNGNERVDVPTPPQAASPPDPIQVPPGRNASIAITLNEGQDFHAERRADGLWDGGFSGMTSEHVDAIMGRVWTAFDVGAPAMATKEAV